MKTVLIIGAGASRAEAESQKAKLTQRPPLDADFFSLAEHHDVESRRHTVSAFMKKTYGIDLFKHPRPGMEQVFSLIYTSTLSNPLPAGVEAAFTSLCRIYAKVIASTTNWIEPPSKGPLCRLIRHSASHGACTVITFNQDLVIEKALHRLTTNNKTNITWHIDTGYELAFNSYTSPPNAAPETVFSHAPTGIRCSIKLLKPHGSLSWYAKTLKKDQVLSQFRKHHTIYCTTRKSILTDMTYTSPNEKGRKKWYTWPVIVPPVFEKGTFLGDVLSPVWTKAFEAVSGADQVIVYGYSFPETDHQSKSFFLRSVSTMKNKPRLVTINPDFGATSRAQAIFQPSSHIWAENVRSGANGVSIAIEN